MPAPRVVAQRQPVPYFVDIQSPEQLSGRQAVSFRDQVTRLHDDRIMEPAFILGFPFGMSW